jgi:class 3 adenylate cyclase
MQKAIREMNAQRVADGLTVCELSIGIHCGETVHGFVGAPECLQFVVIGGDMIMASRYSGGARAGDILVSPEMYQRTAALIDVEKVSVPASHGELAAYRINGFRH